jgi:hypothetical protein
MWWIIGIVAVVLLILLRAAMGLIRSLRLGNEQLGKALIALKAEDIPRLVHECREFFAGELGITLDSDQWKETALSLDSALKNLDQRRTILRRFARPDCPYYWVLPVGAYLGDLLARHAKAAWKFNGTGSPTMEIEAGGGTMTTFPFDKVEKHVLEGDPGDLVAYVDTQINIDQMLSRIALPE